LTYFVRSPKIDIIQFANSLSNSQCTKPDKKEFTQIARATAAGFAIMGFIGFAVKLVHIPINNLLVGN